MNTFTLTYVDQTTKVASETKMKTTSQSTTKVFEEVKETTTTKINKSANNFKSATSQPPPEGVDNSTSTTTLKGLPPQTYINTKFLDLIKIFNFFF
jgi:hypothetical protein